MKKLIIVDDDPAIIDALQLVFAPHYKVTALTSADAILNLDIELPDLFILDKQLAGVDGLDVCRFLKTNETTRDIPVLMMSASPSILTLANEYGCDAAIEKPFPIKRIKQEVANLLERASLHR